MSTKFNIESVINSYKDVLLSIPKASQEYIQLEFMGDGTKVNKCFFY